MKSPLGEYRFVPSFFRSPNSSVWPLLRRWSFSSFLSLSWHSSCFTPAFSPDLPCLLGDLSLRSIGLHGSIVLLNVFARNFPRQRFQTISNLLTNISQKSDYLIYSYYRCIQNKLDLQNRNLARQFTKQILLRGYSFVHIVYDKLVHL